MIVELGHFALVVALVVALVQGTVPLWAAQRRHAGGMGLARHAAIAQFFCVAIAFLALLDAFIGSDFSVANVVSNSHSTKPLLYRIGATWGSHEGSMLLWVLILALFGAMIALFGRTLPTALGARVLAIQGLIGTGFLSFVLFTSNPFERVWPPPPEGMGFNPLLQDPGLVFHPPFLYLGYVGFSVAFSFAVAALIEGAVDAAWARWVRPWTLGAWCALTIGIAMGSWWAYYELGWGGFWFWDPVENASFMPWLAGTALLHSAIVVEKRDALKSWTILLAILTFSLSLVGTFLVRSGVLTSVHAFAVDPGRGRFVLALLVLAVGGSLALYAWRAPALKAGGLFAPVSREGGLLLNNLLLATGTATVFVGTLYPLFLEAMGGGKVSVGPPFFNATFVPLMLPLVAALGIGPMLAWKRGDVRAALMRLRIAVLAALAVVAVTAGAMGAREPMALLWMGMAAWLAAASLSEWAGRVALFTPERWRRMRGLPRASWGMTVAHLGLAVSIAGVTATGAWQTELIRVMMPGQSATIAGYTLTFEGVTPVNGSNWQGVKARFLVADGPRRIGVLSPERRTYPVERQTTTEAAIRTTFFADLYAVIGDPEPGGGHVVRLYYNPLVPWIWIGAVIMAFGGMISLSDRRLRVGAPVRARRSPASPAPAE